MITDFVSKELESYKQLPLRLYQVTGERERKGGRV